MHVIAGLPRSGSTLLCNILNQNPAFFASSTSDLPAIAENIINIVSGSPVTRGDLGRDRNQAERRIRKSIKAFCESWYDDDRTIFDKSRGWTSKVRLLQFLFPQGKAIVLLRDLREVFASFEKQHRKNPTLRLGPPTTVEQRAKRIFDPQGMIGLPLAGIKNIVDAKQSVYFLKYEDLVSNPQVILDDIYDYLKEEKFTHNFNKVINTATDPDHLWLNKYPHKGEGKVKQSHPQWHNYISEPFGNAIVSNFRWYYQLFYPDVLGSNVD
jgi:sulfotransferase